MINKTKKSHRLAGPYNLVLILTGLPVFLYTLWHSIVSRDKQYFFQRLGFSYPRLSGKPVWIHVASVGEAGAVVPLISLLLEQQSERPVLLTTFTTTGAAFVRNRLSSKVYHAYLPHDFNGAVKRFLNAMNPECAVIMETEIWPNLYYRCYRHRVPMVLVNARLSQKTLQSGKWLRKLYVSSLNFLEVILARSEDDKQKFIELGAAPEKIKVIGNIKYSYKIRHNGAQSSRVLDRPYVLVASTHYNEEERVLRIWKAVEARGYLLVIAPRHPDRLNEILNRLTNITGNIAVRSRQDEVNYETQVYLVDTLGELPVFMRDAEFVFMGGSLVRVGGHNIIEPANFGKAIIFGPHMENFSEEAALFLENEAAVQVNKDRELTDMFQQLINNPEQCHKLGQNAEELVAQYQGVAQRYLQELKRYCQH